MRENSRGNFSWSDRFYSLVNEKPLNKNNRTFNPYQVDRNNMNAFDSFVGMENWKTSILNNPKIPYYTKYSVNSYVNSVSRILLENEKTSLKEGVNFLKTTSETLPTIPEEPAPEPAKNFAKMVESSSPTSIKPSDILQQTTNRSRC